MNQNKLLHLIGVEMAHQDQMDHRSKKSGSDDDDGEERKL